MTQDPKTFFDTEFGLSQLSGNRDLLIKMLDRFSSDYVNIDEELKEIVAQSDFTAGRAKAHTIKGVAGNLGFVHLHGTSKLLEDMFKDGAGDFATATEAFVASLQGTFKAIEDFKTGGSTPQEAPQESAAPVGAKEELMTLLENFEFIDADKLGELMADAGVPEDKRPEIEEAINDLDYPTAIELLNA